MFEVGMSALVLKICSEYAKSLGLNFPPCTQQEINAICEWVDKHAVKDMTISQNGYIVTFTFKGEYDTTKEFTITIPKNVDVIELEKVLFGSNNVEVYRLPGNSGLQVKLAQSVINDINSKLNKPETPTADSAVTMLADGTVGTKPLSEIGGGSGGVNIYKHNMYFSTGQALQIRITVYTSNETKYTPETFFANKNNTILYCCGNIEIDGKRYVITDITINNDYKSINYIDSQNIRTGKNINVSNLSGSDTVTKL